MSKFLALIFLVRVQGDDTVLWKETRRGNFSVKLCYNSLCDETNIVSPTKEI